MFACIYSRSVSKSGDSISGSGESAQLIDLAFTFSPLVEQTTADTLVLDISGQDLLFGTIASTDNETECLRNIANEIVRCAKNLNLKVNVAVGAKPDAVIHAARSFKGVTVIGSGEELSNLGGLSIKQLDFSLAGIDAKRAAEIHETFALWGIRTFSEFARLPLAGVAERLGQDGVRLQKLAQGKTDRNLNLIRPPIGFEQSLELECPVTELEPLSFILSRLLNQLCANLNEYALATNELRLELKLQDNKKHARVVTLPVPTRHAKTFLRLLLLNIEAQPPSAPIIAVAVSAEPVKPRASQAGLFIPLAPEPDKLEITLARLAKLVGPENVGSPEILDTHRWDAFRMRRFRLEVSGKRSAVRKENRRSAVRNPQCVMGFRMFRPAWRADVRTKHGTPTHINARSENTSCRVRGEVVCAAGPWRGSGDWWRGDVWARDEWDLAVIDPASPESEVLCRIYRDLVSGQWFVAGIYD